MCLTSTPITWSQSGELSVLWAPEYRISFLSNYSEHPEEITNLEKSISKLVLLWVEFSKFQRLNCQLKHNSMTHQHLPQLKWDWILNCISKNALSLNSVFKNKVLLGLGPTPHFTVGWCRTVLVPVPLALLRKLQGLRPLRFKLWAVLQLLYRRDV